MNADPNPSESPASDSRLEISAGAFSLFLGLLIAGAFPLVLAGVNSFFYRDYGVIAYPFVQFHREQFWGGDPWPLWNPLSNCGAPFLAQWGTLVLYPFSLLYLLLPLPWSLGAFCLGHLFLGGLGMFLLSRRWTGNSHAAALAGVAFVFGGFTLSALVWPNYQVALGWMPWVVMLTERAWREGGRRIPLAGLVSALQLLAGVPELVLLTWIALGVLVVLDLTQPARAQFRQGCSKVGRLTAVIVLAAGLTAVQVLPFLDLLEHSQRDAGFATSKWPMPLWGWANLLVPLFRCFITPQWTWFQEGQEFVASYYAGAFVAVLALAALVRCRDPKVWCLGGLALFGVLLALGENGFLLPALRRWLPGLGIARYPIKAIALTAFVLPLLASFAWASMEDEPRPARRAQVVILALGVAAIAAMGGIVLWAKAYPLPYDQWDPMVRNTGMRAGIVVLGLIGVATLRRVHDASRQLGLLAGLWVLLALDGLSHWPNLTPTMPAAHFQAGLARASLKLEPAPAAGVSRVMISPAAELKLLRSGISDWTADFLGKRLALWSNLNALDGMPKVNGSSTLQIREQAQVQKLLYATPETELPALLDFLAVSHVTKPGSAVEWAKRAGPMPWVSIGQRPVFEESAAALARLGDPAFDPRAIVILPPDARSQVPAEAAPRAKVTLRRVEADRMSVAVETEQPAIVVIAQTFHGPWRAWVDGDPAPLLRANYAFQAVPVPGGRHEVTVEYMDQRFRLGLGVTVGTLLVCLAWLRKKPRCTA